MTESFIQLPDDGQGKRLRTDLSGSVHTQIQKISDSANAIIDPAKENGNLGTLAGKDFATSVKQDTLIAKDFATETTLVLIKNKTDTLDVAQSALNYPAGSGSNGTVTLTNASAAYTVPTSASAKNHVLIVYNGSDSDMYVGYATLTTGGILLAASATMSFDLGANQQIYVYCTSPGKVINYTYKEVS